MKNDHYRILGVPRDATSEEIRAAYLHLAQTSHPDLNPEDLSAEAKFKSIQLAYEILVDPVSRQAFDRGKIEEPIVHTPEWYPPPQDFNWVGGQEYDQRFDFSTRSIGLDGVFQNTLAAFLCLVALGAVGYGR